MKPGAIRLHVIPRDATSNAIDFVKPTRADLDSQIFQNNDF